MHTKNRTMILTLSFILIASFLVPVPALSQEKESKNEIPEKYRLMYEKMKKSQKAKPKEDSSKESKESLRKKRQKEKAMELVRKRQEIRKKVKEAWVKKFREESANLVHVDTPPNLKKSKKGPQGMTYIPRGKFMRGQDWGEWPDNQPSRNIYLNSYYIDTYEVTVGLYKAYLKENKKPIPFSLRDADLAGDNQPLFKVTWKKALDFCNYYDKRLPTEAEWEKAARGWDNRYYPWGSALPDDDGEYRANYGPGTSRGMDGFLYTADIGSYKNGVSPYGVHDMAGNVAEWTADWYDHDYYKTKVKKNPMGPEEGTQKVVRGGGYDVNYQNLLLTVRIAAKPNVSNNFIGFRCAKDAK